MNINDRMRRVAHNSGLAKVAVQYSAETFVVNQSLVLHINICGKNRHIRQVLYVSGNYNRRPQTKSFAEVRVSTNFFFDK